MRSRAGIFPMRDNRLATFRATVLTAALSVALLQSIINIDDFSFYSNFNFYRFSQFGHILLL